MSKEINMDDPELEALMAELEAQNEEIAAAVGAAEPASEPEPEPAPDTAVQPKPERDPEPVEPGPIHAAPDAEPEPEQASAEPEPAPPTQESEAAYVAEVSSAAPWTEEELAEEAKLPPVATGIADTSMLTKRAALPEESITTPVTDAATGLQYYVDVDQFRTDTRVSDVDLDRCMIEQSGLRAYYGAQAANAEAQYSRLKMKFEVIEAKLYNEHRTALASSGEKVTEKLIENAVKTDPRWFKAKNRVIEAETISDINRALVDSLRDRKDMLVQLGADRREEGKGQVRILTEQASRDNLAARALAAAKYAIEQQKAA